MDETIDTSEVRTAAQVEADRVIDAFGGTVAVAEMFGITTGGVSQWRTSPNGIPDARMFSFKLMRPELFQDAA